MDSAKIMIVEDNTMVSEDCRDCLESLGYTVTSIVASGEESIERAGAEMPDAVLMDIRLRDHMDGIQAAEEIHSLFDIPVVFLSAYSDNELLERAKRVGSFGYLVKPFEERELYATLEMALYKARTDKERRQMEASFRQAQKMESIATLAGGIAHQFNNCLAVITGNVDLLEMDFAGYAKIADYAQEIKSSAHRMSYLSSQLLAYARGGKYQTEKISLSDFVKQTLPLLKHAIDPAMSLHLDLPRDIFNVEIDLAQMQMVLSAVVVNASEAMEGKGSICIVCENKVLTNETVENYPELKPGDYACLTVTDDGMGMDEEIRNRMFEPFFTTKFQGRGLGMAAVYGIVKNHDGWISVVSEKGQGTTVKIYLPVARYSDEKHKEPKPRQVKGKGTILVIEDEESVMKVSRAILKKLGYRVIEAKTGKAAINRVKNFDGDIDLAMLDVLLPDMSGNAVYPFLMEARPNLKVIVFSGYSIDGPVQEILDAGAQGYIQKPFAIAELSEKLKTVLSKS